VSVRFNKGVVFIAVGALAAAAAPVGLLSADASTSAVASTAACGGACTSLYVESLGSGDYLTVSGSESNASIEMATASTTNSAQDFTPEQLLDTVSEAAQAGLISNRLAINYPDDALVEYQYAPDGKPSNYCLADGTGNELVLGDSSYYPSALTVTLAQCGITPATLWIADNNGQGSGVPAILINAGYEAAYTYEYNVFPDETGSAYASPFDEPDVLTVTSNSSGSGGSVALAPLSDLGGVIPSSQLWSGLSPEVNAALQESAVREKAAAKAGG
jgi:hypothetical protein